MDKTRLLQQVRLYLFDMDGTLYLGDRLYDFTIELLDTRPQVSVYDQQLLQERGRLHQKAGQAGH